MTSVLLILSLFGASSVRAANDWSVPCVAGGCSWDTGDGKTTAYSSMAIGGSNVLVSDITPAAGWAISGCDPNWKSGSQTIQLTCTGNAKQTAHCSHVFEGGAENTIVRLPENCGKGPFARVVSVKNQTNSNISPRASRHGNRLVKTRPAANSTTARGANSTSTSTARAANATSPSPARPAKSATTPSPAKSSPIGGTHTFTLDYNFKQIPSSRGKVTFAVTSTNLKGLPGVSKRDLDALRGRGRAGDLHRRNFGHLGVSQRGIGDFLSNAANSVGNFVGDAASAVTSAAGSAASAIGNAVANANTVNQNLNSGNIPVNFEKDVVLFDQSISCNSPNSGGGGVSGNAQLKVDVDGKLDASVSFGATIVGTIVPPQVSDFSVSADLGGTVSATFNVDAKAVGSFDSSAVSLFKTGLPGLSIPGVAALGPEFSINGQLTLDLRAEAQMAITTAWDIPNVHLVFPPDKGSSTGAATASSASNPLQLSVDPTLDVSASVGAHIIPRVDFGVDIFSGTVSASVFVDTDISATLAANAKAQAQIQNSAAAAASATAAATSTTADNLAAPAATTFANDTAADAATDTATSTDPAATDDAATDAAASTDPAATDDAATATDTDTATDPAATDDAAATDTATSPDAAATDDASAATDGTTADPASSADNSAVNADNADNSAADPATDSTDNTSAENTAADPSTNADDTSTDDAATDPSANADDTSTDNTATDPSANADDTSTDNTATDPSANGDNTSTDNTATDPSANTDNTSTDDAAADPSTTDDSGFFKKRSLSELRQRAASGSVEGCITLSGGISINGGLQGSLEPLIRQQQKTFNIFSKDVQLFQKCLNGGAAQRREVEVEVVRRAGGLQCPTNGIVSALKSLI